MPSPFPGMDPYLEHPVLFPGIHLGLISELQSKLNEQLRPKYFAAVEERVYISDDEDPGQPFLIPDIHIVQREPSAIRSAPAAGGVILIEPVEVTTLIYDEVHEARIEIVDSASKAIVTVIEILSPSNKLPGSYGRKNYLEKRHNVTRSASHFVEIDLLRLGERSYVREHLPPHDYRVTISRAKADDGRRSTVWPIPLQLPLPEIPIPLKSADPDAQINMQQLLDSVYKRTAIDMRIDYTRDPQPPLTSEQSAWARRVIQQHSPVRQAF